MSVEGYQPSLSETSHKSQDSGFSDSEGHGTMVAYEGGKPKSSRMSYSNIREQDNLSSFEDLRAIPPPPHSSTPNQKHSMNHTSEPDDPIFYTRDW